MIFRSKKNPPAGEMPFLDHLEELRWRLLWSILAVLVGTLVGFWIVTHFNVLEILINPVRPFIANEKLKYLSPGDPFFVTLKLAITVGLILAFPIVVAQVWGFVSPALMPRERRAIIPALYLGLLLFCAGVALAYYLVVPMTLKFMMSFQTATLEQNIVIGPYMGFVVKILLAFGILFELPVVVMVLAALGLITSRFMIEKRRYAIAGMAVIAAFVTPGDAVTLTIFMIGPLLLLYELSIGLAKMIERRRARALVESVAIIALLLMAAPASAQERPQQPDTAKPKSAREIVLRRLRTLNESERRDTVRADSTARPVTERPGTPLPVPGAQAAGGDFPLDSTMQRLLQLPGFSATRYRGRRAEFSADSSELVLFGDTAQRAGVMRDGQSMLADSVVTFNEMTSIACGYGHPILSGGTTGSPVTSQQVCYDTRNRVGMALGARTQVSEGANWYITGDMFTRGTDSYSHDATFTDCSLEIPHYHFAMKEMKIVRNDVMVGRNVTLNFGDVPVFWLPFFMQSMKRGRRSGLLMPEFSVNDIVRRNAGYNRRIKDLGFYWAVSENWGALASMDWWSNNYTALEGSIDYTYPSKFMNGAVTFRRFWVNTGDRDFSVSAQHSMQPNERTTISLDANYVTSTRLIEERSYDPRELVRSITSNAGLTRRFDWGSVSMQLARDQYLTNEQIRYKLPSLGLSLSTINLFEGATWTGSAQFSRTGTDEANTDADPNELNANVSSSFNWGRLSWSQNVTSDDRNTAFIRDTIGGDTTYLLANRHGITWNSSLNFQQRLIGTTTFTPGISAGGQLVRIDTLSGKYARAPIRLDFGAQLKMDLFGFWPGIGSIDRIRHRLSPTIGYSFSPASSIDSIASPLEARVFGVRAGRERNTITIGLNQTFEGRYREDQKELEARRDSAALDSISADPTKPRRIPQARKVSILSLNTDAIVYDFVAAREDDRGIQTAQISNSINSDLLRGLQLSVTHELFRGDTLVRSGRRFDPHLQRINASFSLSNNSWLFRALGLTRKSDADPQTGSVESELPEDAEGGPSPGPEYGIVGNRDRNRRMERQNQQRGPAGAWNASFNLTIERPREVSASAIAREGHQMVTGNISFQPTQNWNVNWSTG
ncbi:MAG TPA: twin-arginine translocase subunit TatC [Longimicrobiales bacterium]|nr:twin-arginine translocase subunit TatC [Longimicrobiales bacterium]